MRSRTVDHRAMQVMHPIPKGVRTVRTGFKLTELEFRSRSFRLPTTPTRQLTNDNLEPAKTPYILLPHSNLPRRASTLLPVVQYETRVHLALFSAWKTGSAIIQLSVFSRIAISEVLLISTTVDSLLGLSVTVLATTPSLSCCLDLLDNYTLTLFAPFQNNFLNAHLTDRDTASSSWRLAQTSLHSSYLPTHELQDALR